MAEVTRANPAAGSYIPDTPALEKKVENPEPGIRKHKQLMEQTDEDLEWQRIRRTISQRMIKSDVWRGHQKSEYGVSSKSAETEEGEQQSPPVTKNPPQKVKPTGCCIIL